MGSGLGSGGCCRRGCVLLVFRGRTWPEEALAARGWLGPALGWRDKSWGLLVWGHHPHPPRIPQPCSVGSGTPRLLTQLQPRLSAEDTNCSIPAGEGKGLICTRCPGSGQGGPPVLQKRLSVAFPAAEPKRLVEEAGRACPRSVQPAREQY